MTLVELEEVADRLSEIVAALDPAVVTGADAVRLMGTFERIQRMSSAGLSLVAARAAACSAWVAAGDRSPEDWLARRCGTDRTTSQFLLETASAAERSPELDQAMRAGEISPAQARQMAPVISKDPSHAPALIQSAKSRSMTGLKEDCRAALATTRSREDDQARAERLHRRRSFRHWIGNDGEGRLAGQLAPEAYARFLALLEPYERLAKEQASQEGRRESFDAYRADALVAMAASAATPFLPSGATTGESPASPAEPMIQGDPETVAGPKGRRLLTTEVIVVIDYQALVRGHTESGERCYIEGLGSVPVSVVQEMMQDAFLAAVVTDGIDIRSVVHLGRHPNRLQKTALRVRDPHCVVPGCDATRGLQHDHNPPFEQTLHTTLDELNRLCAFHHSQKTNYGAQLSGGPGSWKWTPPPPGPFDGVEEAKGVEDVDEVDRDLRPHPPPAPQQSGLFAGDEPFPCRPVTGAREIPAPQRVEEKSPTAASPSVVQ